MDREEFFKQAVDHMLKHGSPPGGVLYAMEDFEELLRRVALAKGSASAGDKFVWLTEKEFAEVRDSRQRQKHKEIVDSIDRVKREFGLTDHSRISKSVIATTMDAGCWTELERAILKAVADYLPEE